MAIQNVSSLVGNLPLDNVLSRQVAEQQLGKHIVGQPTNNAALVQQAQDTYAAGRDKGKVDLKGQAPLGQQPATASPHANYSHQAGQTRGTYFMPLDSDQVALSKGNKVISGRHLGRIMNEKDAKYAGPGNPEGFRFAATREKLIKQNNLVQGQDGRWLAPVQAPAAGNVGDMIPGLSSAANAMGGTGQVNVAQSSMNFLNRTSWLMPVAGFMAGGIGGMAGGFLAAKALKQTSAGSGLSGLSIAGAAMGGVGGGSSNLVSTVQAAKWGSYATMAESLDGVGGITTAGLSHACRSIMNSHVREAKLDSMIRNISNQGIPIEDLIFMFMAAMGDQYEEKLREAMEKAAIAEKLEQRRDRRETEAKAKSGMLGAVGSAASSIPIYGGIVKGATDMAGKQIEMKAARTSEMEGKLNANMESSTFLMQKVQMLMHKWKQLNEMLSNLMKAMHDMAMTPIRNVR